MRSAIALLPRASRVLSNRLFLRFPTISQTARYSDATISTNGILLGRRYGETEEEAERYVEEPTAKSSTGSALKDKYSVLSGSIHESAPSIGKIVLTNTSLSFEELLIESEVGNSEDGVARLVDLPENHYNYRLWSELLHFRLRLYGIDGARQIWLGMERRAVDWPVQGEYARDIWSAFGTLALKDPVVLEEMWKYMRILHKRTGTIYAPIYVQIIGHSLEYNSKKALEWHDHLRRLHLPVVGQMQELVKHAMQSKEGMKTFRRLLKKCSDRDLYDTLIPRLCQASRYAEALDWHAYFIGVHDLPSHTSIVEPLRRYLAMNRQDDALRKLDKELFDKGVDFASRISTASHENTKISRETANLILGETYGVSPKTIKDEFCARCFATRGLSVDFIIACLASLGVQVLGPLALRELAVRAATVDELNKRLAQLSNAKIALRACVYSRLIEKLSTRRLQRLLDVVLASDQHPDVFEDMEVQQALLKQYLGAEDWPQVYRTVHVLTAFEGSREEPDAVAWSLLLKSHITSANWSMISRVVDDMIVNQISVLPHIAKLPVLSLLRTRLPGRHPVTRLRETDDLAFVTTTLMKILYAGGRVQVRSWKEIFTRFGMDGKMPEIEAISSFLVHYYSLGSKDPDATNSATENSGAASGILSPSMSSDKLPTDMASNARTLREIFTPVWQESVIAWGFDSLEVKAEAAAAGERGDMRWWWGVELLNSLRGRGVEVHSSTVKRICRQRLMILFGPGSSKHRTNMVAAKTNPYSLKEMMVQLNRVWTADKVFRITARGAQAKDHTGNQALRRTAFGADSGWGQVKARKRRVRRAMTNHGRVREGK